MHSVAFMHSERQTCEVRGSSRVWMKVQCQDGLLTSPCNMYTDSGSIGSGDRDTWYIH